MADETVADAAAPNADAPSVSPEGEEVKEQTAVEEGTGGGEEGKGKAKKRKGGGEGAGKRKKVAQTSGTSVPVVEMGELQQAASTGFGFAMHASGSSSVTGTMQIPQAYVGNVIGKGGFTIKCACRAHSRPAHVKPDNNVEGARPACIALNRLSIRTINQGTGCEVTIEKEVIGAATRDVTLRGTAQSVRNPYFQKLACVLCRYSSQLWPTGTPLRAGLSLRRTPARTRGPHLITVPMSLQVAAAQQMIMMAIQAAVVRRTVKRDELGRKADEVVVRQQRPREY